jgi:hypothetical protein
MLLFKEKNFFYVLKGDKCGCLAPVISLFRGVMIHQKKTTFISWTLMFLVFEGVFQAAPFRIFNFVQKTNCSAFGQPFFLFADSTILNATLVYPFREGPKK